MSDPQATYQAIVDSFYRAWFRYHPEQAVEMGVGGYAEQLRPFGDDEIGALITLQEKLLDSLDEFDASELDDDQRIDLELMRGAALLELKELIERDWRRRQPASFLPVHAIYQLTVRPVPEPGAALQGRLSAIPGYLRGARGQLGRAPEQVPVLWLEAAQAEAHGGVAYLRSLRNHPLLTRHRLEPLLDEAAHALEDFLRFLERDIAPHAGGDFACGRAHFEKLLGFRHFLDIDATALRAFGQRLLDETAQELAAVTRELRGDEDVAAMTEALHGQRPPAGKLLERYREEMESARAFLVERDIVTLPVHERLKVVETPVFMRHQIPFAAYLDPQPGDPRQLGLYYVTPPPDEEALGEHNAISLRHTCVHEAWPGHHLHFVTANRARRASTLPRLLNASATCYEGWALYCEQLMQEQGFLDAPESRFVLLKDRLWRALRIIIDVDLHTGGLSVSEAAERMQRQLGFTREQAMADLTWYSQSPTVPMGYAVGWALINATRTRVQAGEPAFSLKSFHDRLLGAGAIALPLGLRAAFGEPLWQDVQRSVFADAPH